MTYAVSQPTGGGSKGRRVSRIAAGCAACDTGGHPPAAAAQHAARPRLSTGADAAPARHDCAQQVEARGDSRGRGALWRGCEGGEVLAVCWWFVSSGWPVGLSRPGGKTSTSLASPPTLTCAVVSPSRRMCMQIVGL